MTRKEKKQSIENLKSKFSSNNTFYFTDTSSFTVDAINKFRRMCFQNGLEYLVAKNTLIKKTLEELKWDCTPLKDQLKKSTGIIFSPTSGSAPAKLIKDYSKGGSSPVFKGAWVESSIYIGQDQIELLSKLKSKDELLGEIVTLLQSPISNLMSALQSGGGKITGILTTLASKTENNI
ncbi:MAG: 50S ribosomal protein L10 [Bacteroidetes bacterium RIFCSPLOWO2_02_FULL_36_8]|nr:MAG: 50S ribosomal protein L10 [Bacteroidetes bacterium RIFCSPLOWO2_02_FULL_36_8]OFY70076.1 MAG: 50S ribosomal protein L10 [Bacteroidetes bacterium RIFCSPLOWO2_12_FULL_37_12]